MSVFADYLDLRVAVGDYVGTRALSDLMARLTQAAESRLNRLLRTRHQITDATLTFTAGSAPLPADFLEMINVFGVADHLMRASVLSDARRRGSEYARYEIGGSQIYIRGFDGERDIQYFAKLPTLTSSDAATNWLLEIYPDAYLYAVGYEAAKHLKNVDLAAAADGLLRDALNTLKNDDDRSRWSNAVVRVQGQTP